MKKSRMYPALLFLVLAAACQREEIAAPESGNDVMEVYATVEEIADVQTKTSLEGTEVLWSSGDKIAVFQNNTLRKRFSITSESVGDKDATFQYDSEYVITGNNVQISNNIAWYPFCELICTPEASEYTLGNINIPDTQSFAESSFASGAFPMVAVTAGTDDVNYRFRNVCGAIMFQLKGSGFIKSVSIEGNTNEVLAGAASVTAAYNEDPSIILSDSGSKTVTLDCGENGVELKADTPTSFIIVLPPVEFEGGFTITVTDTEGGSKEYSTTKKNPIERSKIRRMPVQEYEGKQLPDYIDEYGENQGPGIEIDGVVWAPVNCGYKAPTSGSKGYPYGKLYQWGRKYGQGYSLDYDETMPTIATNSVSMEEGQSAAAANVFYMNTSGSYDWLTDQYDEVWNLGTEDNPIKTEYDPCPTGWRVPTYNELIKLYALQSEWKDNYSGQAGSLIYDNSSDATGLFLPAAGLIGPEGGIARNESSRYWSSLPRNHYEPYISAHFLMMNSNGVAEDNIYGLRMSGCSVRCVKDDSELIPVESVALDQTYMTIYADPAESFSLKATVYPENANHQSVIWHSDNTSVVLPADDKGNMIAVSSGVATVTVMAGMKVAKCTVTILPKAEMEYVDENGISHGKGVEIDGVVWAPVNCGYHKTDYPYGKLYQWGRKYGQGYSGDTYDENGNIIGTYSDASVPTVIEGPVDLNIGQSKSNEKYFYANNDWLSQPKDDLWNSGTEENPKKTEYDPCPVNWRVPTYAELMIFYCYSSSVTTVDGINGYWSSSFPIDGAPQVFFPAAGYRHEVGSAKLRGSNASYWSSMSGENVASGKAAFIAIGDPAGFGYADRSFGFPVRCVQE